MRNIHLLGCFPPSFCFSVTPSQGKGRVLNYEHLGPLFVVHGEGNGTPLQYSCLENPMDRGAQKDAVHGVAEGRSD